MYSLIIILPFLGFLCAFFLGFYFGRQGCFFLTCFCLFCSFCLGLLGFYEVVLCRSPVVISFWTWFALDVYIVTFGMLFDSLTCTMILIITFISLLVHIYSVGYMSSDPHASRFMGFLSLFTFFMLLLVSSDNFVQLFIGWEGVGLCSYLLINFWFGRYLANKAALKAMIINRISDVVFIFGIILIFLELKTVDFVVVFELIHFLIGENIVFFGICISKIDLICFFFLFGVLGKSAQLGFHTWLPDAMEGPTPVSALLHAATMVTAGVFLILRSSPIFEYSNIVLSFVTLIGGLTAFFSALVGLFQYDIKKVIAYSTCSQLGYMVLCCGLSYYQVSCFHLFNHAFFKALLFLSAGSVIHALLDEQDMRKMGSLVNFMPITYLGFFFGSLSIVGIYFFTGFYSKDLIIELTYTRYIVDGYFIYFLCVSSAFLTACYSGRMLFFIFFAKSNFFKSAIVNISEDFSFITIPILILSFFSVFIGYIFSVGLIGYGSYYWNNSLFFLFEHFDFMETNLLSPLVKNLPILVSIFGFLLSFLISFSFQFIILTRNNFYFRVFDNLLSFIGPYFYYAGFFNYLYNNFFMQFFSFTYNLNTKVIDKGFLEILGPHGLYKIFFFVSFLFRVFAPHVIFFSIFIMFIFVCFSIFLIILFSKFIISSGIANNLGLLLVFFFFSLNDFIYLKLRK